MATLTKQTFDEAGNDLTMASAAAGGDQFANPNGTAFLVIHNGDTSSKDVTVTAQNTSFEDDVYGDAVKQDQTLTVAAGSTAVMGPFPKRAFNDGSGNVQVTYSAVTSVEIAVVEID
jgi:hypothetical protein